MNVKHSITVFYPIHTLEVGLYIFLDYKMTV